MASGLKININKSKLMGYGVHSDEVEIAARHIGYATFVAPFTHLEVKVRGRMDRTNSWDDVVSKVTSRLSKWKLKTLSIGGRLTLIKSILTSIPLYQMSSFKVPIKVLNILESIRRKFFNGIEGNERKLALISWDNVLASKKHGGLGVSSFFAMNQALLSKWVWRFFYLKHHLYGLEPLKLFMARKGILELMVKLLDALRGLISFERSMFFIIKVLTFLSLMRKKVVNGEETLFWKDSWFDWISLKQQFTRLYLLESNKHINVAEKMNQPSLSWSYRREPGGGIEEEQQNMLFSKISGVILPNMRDRWIWSLEASGDFSVTTARHLIDDHLLPKGDVPTRWVKAVPIKINVFAWRVCLDKLPTRLNLSLRGIEISSIMCPLCNSSVESASHLFFSCHVSRLIWKKILRWWDLDENTIDSYDEWLLLLKNIRLPKRLKDLFEGVCYVKWWLIWRIRNQVLFGDKHPLRDTLFDDLVTLSFQWCSNRCKSKLNRSAVRKTTTSVPETETSISKTSKDIVEKPQTVRPSAPIIEEWDTDSDNDSVFRPKSDQTKPKFTKINFVKSGENVKSVNKENTHRQVEYLRKSQSPRDNRRNWNEMMTQKLGNGFEFIKKACFVCGSFNHLIKDCDFHDNKMRVNHQNKLTHPHPKRNVVPTAVVTKSRQVPIDVAKQSSPRAATSISTARPVNTAAPKPKVKDALPTTYSYFKAHSPVRRAFNQKSAAKTNNFNEKVNTARVNNVTTAGPKAIVSAAEGNGENVVKSSACWIWRPTGNVINHISKDSGSYMLKRFDYGNPQYTLQDQGIFDSGCSRHMTGNKSFLTDYQEIDGGFVAFGGSPKGGKITRKGIIRTGKLDFEDVYFVKELKFNLFSFSQMCDKKNNVLFTETECLVLSPDFKLLDESQVLLKVPRHDNMYSFDLKNVVPSRGLTCLFAKATIDESNLWHRRLGHINFKTINKLVRGNLVRGLPSKLFENDHTCVACQKGKQHKASCTDLSQMDKNEAKRTKLSTRMERADPKLPHWPMIRGGDPRPMMNDFEAVTNQGLGLDDKDAPQALDPSPYHYK
ncbi:ribonuclease H-like domain-containing protein [Tanacetum coccineum]|uniref:Ribonuclease H-like domain-containing protein n=1 Tax=Tanacetum coccineum TaxID=301880 RepID=A0ABQ5F459_9ASTR